MRLSDYTPCKICLKAGTPVTRDPDNPDAQIRIEAYCPDHMPADGNAAP